MASIPVSSPSSAIGAGPSNLALGIALEELAPDGLARNSVIIEQHEDILWQRGLLIPWAQSQVSFLKDLVTLWNPCSEFTFLNYLHSVGRLDQFVNLATFTPYRSEISDYLQWVAKSLRKVQIEYGRRCVGIQPFRSASGDVTAWLAQFAAGMRGQNGGREGVSRARTGVARAWWGDG